MSYIIEITTNNQILLNNFISNNIFPDTFRYFNKRSGDIIKNHVITILLIESNIAVGYAHIDFDNNKNWFGICVLDNYQRKGYGNQLIKYIFNHKKIQNLDKIYLTVDKINIIAIKLYLKLNFKIINQTETYFTMLKMNQSR
jgi:GNAT superfamily N-acetyltransferase